jgi:hypothetical protein
MPAGLGLGLALWAGRLKPNRLPFSLVVSDLFFSFIFLAPVRKE